MASWLQPTHFLVRNFLPVPTVPRKVPQVACAEPSRQFLWVVFPISSTPGKGREVLGPSQCAPGQLQADPQGARDSWAGTRRTLPYPGFSEVTLATHQL